MTTAKTATVLDKRRKKQDGTFPAKLRVTFERKQVYYSTPYDLTEKEFERVMFSKRLRGTEKALKKKVTAFENKAIEIIQVLPIFTWKAFEKHYLTNRGAKDTINLSFADYAKELRDNDRIGTAVSYECAQSKKETVKALTAFKNNLQAAG